MYVTFRIFLLSLLSLSAMAQYPMQIQGNSSSKKANKLYVEANELIQKRKFFEGIELLEKAVKADPEFADAYYLIGSTYTFILDPPHAVPYYQKALELKPDELKYTFANFTLAQFFLQKGEYEKTVNYARKYLESNPSNRIYSDQAQRMINTGVYAIEGLKNPVNFHPIRMPDEVNAFRYQYFPVLTADNSMMVYTVRTGKVPIDDEDLMVSYKIDGGWTSPVSISEKINTQNNEGTPTISADGKTMIYTICDPTKGCDLYISEREGYDWSSPQKMKDKVNSPHRETQPALSADGNTLYFVSNRPGGLGKQDIWMSYRKDNGEWSMAVNAGATINTSLNDISPFIHADNKTLYFASEGLIGYGDYDLFKTVKTETDWTEPENLGYPVNTHSGETSLFITADNKYAFYSVDKMKNLRPDSSILHYFEIPASMQSTAQCTYVKGKVTDEETGKPLKARISLYDPGTREVLYNTKSDSVTGEFLAVLTQGVQYAVYVQAKGYLFKTFSFDYMNPADLAPKQLDITLSPLRQGKAVSLKNIFFETGKYELQPNSFTELQRVTDFLKNNPGIKVEIAGHTDNVGVYKDNLKLSTERAKAVKDYLTGQGIPASRITTAGYADKQPVAPNDSDANRALNRRIEFKIEGL